MFQPIYHVSVSPTDGNGPTQGQRKTPVVQTLDSAIHWINHYPLDNSIGFASVYPLDSNLAGGQRYPSFEQLGPGWELNPQPSCLITAAPPTELQRQTGAGRGK